MCIFCNKKQSSPAFRCKRNRPTPPPPAPNRVKNMRRHVNHHTKQYTHKHTHPHVHTYTHTRARAWFLFVPSPCPRHKNKIASHRIDVFYFYGSTCLPPPPRVFALPNPPARTDNSRVSLLRHLLHAIIVALAPELAAPVGPWTTAFRRPVPPASPDRHAQHPIIPLVTSRFPASPRRSPIARAAPAPSPPFSVETAKGGLRSNGDGSKSPTSRNTPRWSSHLVVIAAVTVVVVLVVADGAIRGRL